MLAAHDDPHTPEGAQFALGSGSLDNPGAHTLRSSALPSRPSGRNRMTTRKSISATPSLYAGENVVADQVFQHADQHAAEQRAARLVEAADDRREEGLLPDRVAHVELREVRRRDQERRDDREHGIDEERVQHHPRDVDAEHARGLGVLRDGLHRAAR